MALIDEARAEAIYAAMGPAMEISGGSAANTIVGVASLRRRAPPSSARCADDSSARVRARHPRRIGVHFDTPPATDGPSTARCLILVTPDGERTMNTYLGACAGSSPGRHRRGDDRRRRDHLSRRLSVGPAGTPRTPSVKAATAAHAAGRQVALTLSDAFCVDRYRDEFLDLIRDGRRYPVRQRGRAAQPLRDRGFRRPRVRALREDAKLAVVTRSEKGCVSCSQGRHDGGAGAPFDEAGRHHRRRRPVRRGLPVGLRAARTPPPPASAASPPPR